VDQPYLALESEELRAVETALFARGDEVLDHAKEVAKTIRERVHIATIQCAASESVHDSPAVQADGGTPPVHWVLLQKEGRRVH
jgi:hypothetical protein